MIKPFLRKVLICCCFMAAVPSYSQSIDFNPLTKDSLAVDSIYYKVSGYIELTDSLEFRLELVEIHPDSLHVVYQKASDFDQNIHPTNNLLSYNPASQEFEVRCGIFPNSDLMVHVMIFKEEEMIYQTYYK